MAERYKEVPFRGQRPSPWKMKPLPKFIGVPGRKFNDCITKNSNQDPPTPPPSPMSTFKYPALLRGSKSWPRTTSVYAIVTELHKTKNNHTAFRENEKQLKKVQLKKPQSLTDDVKPTSGKTKTYLWPKSGGIDCWKLDSSSFTQEGSGRSLSKFSQSKVEDVAMSSAISVIKKLKNIVGVEDTKKEMSLKNTTMSNPPKNCFATISTEDFEVILKHALSHDSVITKQDSTFRI